MKVCRECNSPKPLSEYYAHPTGKDGHVNKCKSCQKRRIALHRTKNIERIRAYDRVRGRTEKRLRKNRERHRARTRQYAVYKEKWRKLNLEKTRAHMKLQRAVNSGRLQRAPCEVCGTKKVEAHHDDYAQPLNVRWLCRKHHAEVHRKYGE